MIKSSLIQLDGDMGSKVELGAVSDERKLQIAQYRLELSSIFDALDSKFGKDDAIEIITSSLDIYINSHS